MYNVMFLVSLFFFCLLFLGYNKIMVLFSYYKVSFFIVNEKKNLHSAADNKRHEVILSKS